MLTKKRVLKNTNIPEIITASNKIKNNLSYVPSINANLLSRKTGVNKKLRGCNSRNAMELNEPLRIPFNKKCLLYTSPTARQIMLNRLQMNKHIDIKTLVPPMQMEGNCWFNTMFMSFFISDKGRKFFHFFRQLMIEGKLFNGTELPTKLKSSFALLNFAVDLAITGSPGAFKMDTNYVISEIYDNIKKTHDPTFIVDVGDAGNPLRYYMSIMSYLHSDAIHILNVSLYTKDWKTAIESSMKPSEIPHIVAVEITDEESKIINNKPLKFKLHGATYALDSVIIRDVGQYHFSSTLTCEKKEYAFDGMSFHKIVPMNWKSMINTTKIWSFEGSEDNGKLLEWNFMHSYQILFYYRIK